MANLTQTLSDSIRVFGPQQSTKWGSPMKWGSDTWGNGSTNFSLSQKVVLGPISQSITLLDSFVPGSSLFISLSDALTLAHTTANEYLKSSGYFYVFSGGTINNANAYVPSYAPGSTGSSTWGRQTNSSATYSSDPAVSDTWAAQVNSSTTWVS